MKNEIPKHVPPFLDYLNINNKEIEKFFEYEGIFYKNAKVSLWQKRSPKSKAAYNFREHIALIKMEKEYLNRQRTKAFFYKRDKSNSSEFLREHKIIKDHARKR